MFWIGLGVGIGVCLIAFLVFMWWISPGMEIAGAITSAFIGTFIERKQ